MKVRFIFYFFLFIFAISGCSSWQGLMTLKHYGDSQEEINLYVQRQEKLFFKLIEDLKSGKLKAGISKDRFIRLYGDPVLSDIDESSPDAEVLLFRHPTDFFKSDRVYAYFDQSEKLMSWDYKPYQNSE
ncbi:MAG: hypothetical protein JW867_07340 [Candidatus Omnitrophica bacterium]|nr:hypothetical protein [Candidatus Omnitrophota bacterium]